jgi:hypothetical protein
MLRRSITGPIPGRASSFACVAGLRLAGRPARRLASPDRDSQRTNSRRLPGPQTTIPAVRVLFARSQPAPWVVIPQPRCRRRQASARTLAGGAISPGSLHSSLGGRDSGCPSGPPGLPVGPAGESKRASRPSDSDHPSSEGGKFLTDSTSTAAEDLTRSSHRQSRCALRSDDTEAFWREASRHAPSGQSMYLPTRARRCGRLKWVPRTVAPSPGTFPERRRRLNRSPPTRGRGRPHPASSDTGMAHVRFLPFLYAHHPRLVNGYPRSTP